MLLQKQQRHWPGTRTVGYAKWVWGYCWARHNNQIFLFNYYYYEFSRQLLHLNNMRETGPKKIKGLVKYDFQNFEIWSRWARKNYFLRGGRIYAIICSLMYVWNLDVLFCVGDTWKELGHMIGRAEWLQSNRTNPTVSTNQRATNSTLTDPEKKINVQKQKKRKERSTVTDNKCENLNHERST